MKTSRMTMKTGANSTGRSQRLRRMGVSVRSICEFNEGLLGNVRATSGDSLAVRDPVCNHWDPSTREGFILVSKAPPKSSRKGPESRNRGRAGSNGNGSAALARGDGAPRRAELADFLRTRREAVRPEDVGLPAGARPP